MRYVIIFTITVILLLVILFYNPYLGVYKNYINFEFEDTLEDYNWHYEIDNDNIELVERSDHSWKFKANKNGVINLYYIYSDTKNGSNTGNVKYLIYYKLKVKNNKIYWLEGYGEGLLTYPNPF